MVTAPQGRRVAAKCAALIVFGLLGASAAFAVPSENHPVVAKQAVAKHVKLSKSARCRRSLARASKRPTRAAMRRCLRRATATIDSRGTTRRRKRPKPTTTTTDTTTTTTTTTEPTSAATTEPAPTTTTTEPTPTTTPSTPPSWVADYETGSTSQWDGKDGNRTLASTYFKTVTSPTLQGNYAFGAYLDPQASSGDVGQRSLLYLYPNDTASQGKTQAYEGADRWYHTYLYFPSDFEPAPNTSWNWVVEWHNWPDGPCCANVAVSVDTSGGGERLSLRSMGGGNSTYPIDSGSQTAYGNPAAHVDWFVGDWSLERGHWYDLLTHVKWSSDPSEGLLEWWVDGRQIVSRQTSTLFWYADNNKNLSGTTPGSGQAYYMEGYYRPMNLPDGTVNSTPATVYHDAAKIGSSRDSVGG